MCSNTSHQKRQLLGGPRSADVWLLSALTRSSDPVLALTEKGACLVRRRREARILGRCRDVARRVQDANRVSGTGCVAGEPRGRFATPQLRLF